MTRMGIELVSFHTLHTLGQLSVQVNFNSIKYCDFKDTFEISIIARRSTQQFSFFFFKRSPHRNKRCFLPRIYNYFYNWIFYLTNEYSNKYHFSFQINKNYNTNISNNTFTHKSTENHIHNHDFLIRLFLHNFMVPFTVVFL